MHFHIFLKTSKTFCCSLISISTILFFISLSQYVDSSRGFTYIDKEQPYKSFVGKIVSTHGRNIGSKNSHQIKSKGRTSGNQKSSRYNPLTKGRTVEGDKPNWYYADPLALLGRSIKNYEPSDPNELDPSAKTKKAKSDSKGSSGKNDDPENIARDSGTGDSSDNKKGSSESGGSGSDHKKGSDDSSSSSSGSHKEKSLKPTGNLRVVEFDGDEVDPSAPGWFALKPNSEYGKKLMLGTLLRKKGHGVKDPNKETLITDLVGSSEDGSNNDTSELFSPLIRRYDKACLYLEYMDAKREAIPFQISTAVQDTIKAQNYQLADFFLNLAFKTDIPTFTPADPLNKQEPVRAMEILTLTKDIFFKFICKDKEYDEVDAESNYDLKKDKLLPKYFFEMVWSIYLKLFSITTSSEKKDYLEKEEFIWIKSNLEECNQTGGQSKKIEWFPDECKEQVLAFDQENNFACTPFLEFDFNIRKYDPILDFVWHMISSVHSHCFESFQTNARMWHRYALAMADLLPAEMRLRWSASSEDYKKLYMRLFGPNYEVFFDNMNRCMYASNLRSNVPYLMPRFEGDRHTRYASAKYMAF